MLSFCLFIYLIYLSIYFFGLYCYMHLRGVATPMVSDNKHYHHHHHIYIYIYIYCIVYAHNKSAMYRVVRITLKSNCVQ